MAPSQAAASAPTHSSPMVSNELDWRYAMHTTSHMIRTLLLVAAISASLPAAAEPFVYRGALTERGEPAEGRHAFRLTFHDARFGGAPLAAPITLEGVEVRDGAFAAALDLDPALLRRETVWLAVEVGDADGVFTPLADREAVQPKATTAGV